MQLKENSKLYNKNLKLVLESKWLHLKHLKHSYIQVAHFSSIVSKSKNDYFCNVCNEPGSCNEIINKRTKNKTNIRLCDNCVLKIKEKFPAKYHYCG